MKELEIRDVQLKVLAAMRELHSFCVDNNIKYFIIAGTMLGAIRHKGFIPWDDDIDVGMMREDYDKFCTICNKFNSNYFVKNHMSDKRCNYLLTRIYIPNVYVENGHINKLLDQRLYLDIFPIDYVPSDNDDWTSFSKKIKNLKKMINFFYPTYFKHRFFKNSFKKITSIFITPFKKMIMNKAITLIQKYKDCENAEFVCSCATQYKLEKQRMFKTIYGEPVLYQFENERFYGPELSNDYLLHLYGDNYMEIPPIDKRRTPIKYFED